MKIYKQTKGYSERAAVITQVTQSKLSILMSQELLEVEMKDWQKTNFSQNSVELSSASNAIQNYLTSIILWNTLRVLATPGLYFFPSILCHDLVDLTSEDFYSVSGNLSPQQ